jgi:hypothetical protein
MHPAAHWLSPPVDPAALHLGCTKNFSLLNPIYYSPSFLSLSGQVFWFNWKTIATMIRMQFLDGFDCRDAATLFMLFNYSTILICAFLIDICVASKVRSFACVADKVRSRTNDIHFHVKGITQLIEFHFVALSRSLEALKVILHSY